MPVKAAAKTVADKDVVTISPPNIQTITFNIRGTAPLVQNKFSQKARQQMREAQEKPKQRGKTVVRESKDFHQRFLDARHVSTEGWVGIPAPSFRNSMITACKIVGFKMTIAKISVFVLADGLDEDDRTPLVRILTGEPHAHEAIVRPQFGVTDIVWRPMWDNWTLRLRVSFDADQFTATDVTNLVARAGLQVGVGEGRPDSKTSNGMGWGTFEIYNPTDEPA